jgi:uncharacterized protein
LRYKIKDIPSDGLTCDQALGAELLREALEGTDADLGASAGAARLTITKSDDDLYVRGSVKATVSLPCGSCLGPARVAIDAPVKMVYTREGDEPDAAEDPLDDSDFGTHDGDVLDLAPMLREQLILSVPMSPRCREDCKGLCPVCGENRNTKSCGHDENATEPHASPLAAQLSKLKLP